MFLTPDLLQPPSPPDDNSDQDTYCDMLDILQCTVF